MAWHGILGHDAIVELFRNAINRGRLASSFLFAGPAGIGKRTFAMRLSQTLLCQQRPEAEMNPCGQCPACVQVEARTHPDLAIVEKPADRQFIPLALLIGDDEHRMQNGLCHHLALRPFMGGRRIAIIDDADLLNPEGANCLLKTLEEPPPGSVLILIGTSPARQLPTIRSRCQLVRFSPLATDDVRQILLATGLQTDPTEAANLAELSEGSLQQAMELADPQLRAFRNTLWSALEGGVSDFVGLTKQVAALVEDAGKEAPARRARLRQLANWAVQYYRRELKSGGGEAAQSAIESCLAVAEQIDRNANQSTLIETWLNELAAAR